MGVGRSERGKDDAPVPDLWKVVGGQETGGIVVRKGVSLDSKELGERLSTGAIITTKMQQSNRVHYSMISGTGPESGWVSIRMQCTDQIVKLITAGADKEKTPKSKANQDLMEAALVPAKKLGATTLAVGATEARLTAPLEWTRQECLASMESMLLLALEPHIQREFHKAWEAVKRDPVKFEREQRRVVVLALGEMLELLGVDLTWEGVVKHRSTYIKALGKDIFQDEDQLKRQILMKWLQTPEYQQSVPFRAAEVRDLITSIRDPEAAHARAKCGGMVAHWQFDEGHLEIVPVNSKLRVVFIADGQVSRGDLFLDDIWHRALLSNGVSVRLRRSDKPMKLLVSLEGACGWLEDCTACVLDECELASCNVLQREAVTVVRRLAKNWSVATAGPPQEPELAALVPMPLGQLACAESKKRTGLLISCTGLVEGHFVTGRTGLIYASSAGLWFDWWVIESLLAMGFGVASVHFIDARYCEEVVRDAGMRQSSLGDMAAWCRAVGVRSYAHKSLEAFAERHPKAAHVLVHPDCEPEEACVALQQDGLLVSSRGWKCQDDATMPMVPVMEHATPL